MADEALVDGIERSVQNETNLLADASKYLPDLPPPWVTLALVLPVSLVLGMMTLLWEPGNLVDDRPWVVQLLTISLMMFAVPSWVGALFAYVWLRAVGGYSYLYRWSMVMLALQVLLVLVLLFGYVVSLIDADRVPRPEFFLFAFAFTAMFVHVFIIMTSTSRWLVALPATLMMPLLGILGTLMMYDGLLEGGSHAFRSGTLILVLLATFISVGHMAIWLGVRNMSLSYDIDGAKVFRAFLEHWVTGGDAGRSEIEGFFRAFSEPTIVKAEVIAFREKGGDPIATLVIPSLHPGPWGELSGSDLPRKMTCILGGEHGNVLTFHGASDHDLNPADLQEIEKLGAVIKEALDGLNGWTGKASRSIRVTNDTDALAQAFNGAVMAAQTSAPLPTDDVDRAVGYAIEQEMEKVGASPGAFIDCHNCLLPGAGHVAFGSAKAKRIEERIVKATEQAVKAQRSGFRVGVGHIPNRGESTSMGPTGVQTLVVEVDGQRTAWILADGNNLEQGLRERIRECAMGKVDEAEVLTTDNHIVNVTVGGFNPIGYRDDDQLLGRLCSDSLDLALADLREAEVAATRVEAHDVLVWGKGNTVRMTSNLNASVSTSKAALAATLIVGFTVGFWAMWYL